MRQGTSIRDEKLETIVIHAMAERLFRAKRLQQPLANLLDDSSSAVRERQAHLKALRTERTRVEGAIQNMFDFIEQGVVAPAIPTSPRASPPNATAVQISHRNRARRAAASATDRRVTPEAVGRLSDVILHKLRSDDPILRQGYARRFIDKVVVAPDTITISGSVKPLKLAASLSPEQLAPFVPSLAREWCGREDSNFHVLSDTATSRLRVYQFRHGRT